MHNASFIATVANMDGEVSLGSLIGFQILNNWGLGSGDGITVIIGEIRDYRVRIRRCTVFVRVYPTRTTASHQVRSLAKAVRTALLSTSSHSWDMPSGISDYVRCVAIGQAVDKLSASLTALVFCVYVRDVPTYSDY
eukprot:scaffold181981_cov18-Prasinocladus_malaysianus.AAC.1